MTALTTYPSPHDDVLAHHGLAEAAARRFTVRGMLWEDKVQTAWLGLLEALKTWDPAKGPWGPWAYKHARYEMLRVSRENFRSGPFGTREQTEFVVQRLTTLGLGATGTDAEVRARCEGMTRRSTLAPAVFAPMLDYFNGEDVGFDAPADVRHPEGPSVADVLAEGDELEDLEQRDLLERWMALLEEVRSTLSPLALRILDTRLWVADPEDADYLGTIGDRSALSRERVRQVEGQLRRQIRDAAIRKGLLPEGTRFGR